MRKIRNGGQGGREAEGKALRRRPGRRRHRRAGRGHDRQGKLGGAGFYEYADGKRTGLWPGLREHVQLRRRSTAPFAGPEERMLFIEAHRDA